jgi:hypothetical protein
MVYVMVLQVRPRPGAATRQMEKRVVTQLVVGVAAVAFLIYRQLVARRLSTSSIRIALILAVIGVLETAQFLQKHHGGGLTFAALGGSLVLALGFGAARAATVRVWQQDGSTWSQGNWLTAVLWVVAVAAHLGYDALLDTHHSTAGIGEATILLYLAISLAAQRLLLLQRARRMFPQGPATPFIGTGPVSGT